MTLDLDAELAAKLAGGMDVGGLELPFPVIYLWTINGQASYKSKGNALYFGGWCCKQENAEEVAHEKGLELPAAWKLETIATREGGEYNGYVTRALIVAPICKRESWLAQGGRRYPDYVEGGRRHIQMLAFLGERREKQGIFPWGPVVLSAKGYQARNLLDALSMWDKDTSRVRWNVAPGIPAWLFWMGLGTFRSEREVVNVGKPGAQSPITPISLAEIKPEVLERDLESLYVGNEIAKQMAELSDLADAWRTAWRETSTDPFGAEAGAGSSYQEEEIPF